MTPVEERLGPRGRRLPSIREMVQAARPMSSLVLPAPEVGAASNAGPDAKAFADAESSPSDIKARSRPARRPANDMKANLRRSRYRDCEKREIMFLRAYGSALEEELKQLKQQQADRTRKQGNEVPDLTRNSPQKELWKALALLRRGQRKTSEQENARLRALWRTQERFAAQIRQYAVGYRNFGPANGVDARVTIDEADVDMFKMLVDELDGTYREIGRAMAETGINALPEARYQSIRPRGDGETVSTGNVDLMSIAQLCTSFSTVQDILWRGMVARIEMQGGVSFDLAEGIRGSTVAMKVKHVQQGPGSETLVMETIMTSRRYRVSPSSVVVVWRCLLLGKGGVDGMVATESGFSAANCSVSQPDQAVIRRLRRLEAIESSPAPRKDQGKGDTSGEASDKFTTMSLEAIEDDIDSVLSRYMI